MPVWIFLGYKQECMALENLSKKLLLLPTKIRTFKQEDKSVNCGNSKEEL